MILSKDGLTPPFRGAVGRDVGGFRLPRPVGSDLGPYTLLDVIGGGQRGVVYRAELGGRVVALKVLHPGTAIDPGLLLRFQEGREGAIGHPGLARVIEVCGAEGHEFYTRNYLRGDSLETTLAELERGTAQYPHLAPLAPAADGSRRAGFCRHAVSLIADVAVALQRAHDGGVLHGRIHPGNLIHAPSGRLVLTDFEGALTATGRSRTASVQIPGEGSRLDEFYRHYLAPEQRQALRDGTEAPFSAGTDVYSLAAILYQLIHREVPGDGTGGDVPITRDLAVAPALDAILRKAVGHDPRARYPTARALAEDLRRLIDLETTVAEREVPAVTVEPWGRGGLRGGVGMAETETEAGTEAGAETETETETEAETEVEAERATHTEARTTVLRQRLAGFSTLCLLALVVALAGLAVSLRGRLEHHRRESERYRRGVQGLGEAITALADEDAGAATAALASARREIDRGEELWRVEAHLRSRAADPATHGLLDRRAAVRLEAIDTLEADVLAGRRPPEDLHRVASLLWDGRVAVRRRAIRALGRANLEDLLLEGYGMGQGKVPVHLDGETFLALYRALADGAARGRERALEVIRAMDLEVMESLDAAAAGGRITGGDAAPGEDVRVPPNIRVAATTAGRGAFVREWIVARSRPGDAEFLEYAPRLARREELLPELLAGLERVGSPRAIDALRELAARRVLRWGPEIVEALGRLGASDTLLEMASEPLPLPLRALAVRRAAAVAPEADRDTLARVLLTHPDPPIRREALRGLDSRRHFSRDCRPLAGALGDPFLRGAVLEILARQPCGAAIPDLLRLLDASSSELRVEVVRALGATGEAAVLHPLARQLFETDRSLRQATLAALRLLEDDRALPLAVGILGSRHAGVPELALAVLEIADSRRREDPQILVLAFQEIFGLMGPIGESLGISSLRRILFLAPLGWDVGEVDRRLPERIREIGRRQ